MVPGIRATVAALAKDGVSDPIKLEDAPPAINELALSKLVAPARSPATATP